MTKKRLVGRPRRPPRPGERVTLGLRVSADLKRKLEKDAVKAGRSLSQEAELRLERSYDRQKDREEMAILFQAKVVEAWLKMRDKP